MANFWQIGTLLFVFVCPIVRSRTGSRKSNNKQFLSQIHACNNFAFESISTVQYLASLFTFIIYFVYKQFVMFVR